MYKVTHSENRSRSWIPTIESMLILRLRRWLGHIIRMPCSRLPPCVLHGQPRLGHWSVGGQKHASRITSSRSIKSATFLLKGWRLYCPTELPGDQHVPLECHTLTMNTFELLLSEAVADISMLHSSAEFRILLINAHFVADNASHTLASSDTARSTINVDEEIVVIRNGLTPKKMKPSRLKARRGVM